MTFKTTFASALTAVSLALAAPLAAQETQAPEIAAEDVTDDQVNAFVDALVAVEEVRNDYVPKIEAQESEADQTAMIEEANTAALEAVEAAEDISPDEYMAIIETARADEELNERIMARLETVTNE